MDETRKRRVIYAASIIKTNQYVVCVCGQLFHEPEPYADHVETCSQAARSDAAAGKFGTD